SQVVARLGAGQVASAHADRTTAFDGADYLINEIQVGGYEATLRAFEIPKRYGLRQTIADTIGIGGIMRGLRTIPVMIQMADEMMIRCPDGLLLNYANPMAMVPWGIWAGSTWPAAQTIGVCHSVRDTHAFLASLIGVPEERIAFRTAGFNHQCFVYGFRDRATDEDLYPRLREGVEVPVTADADGVRRTRIGALPHQCLALNRTFLNVVELTVRAVVEGARELVYRAAMLDPNTGATLTTSEIVAMVDDLIDAHGDLIPDTIR